jgi:hypothetical protein
MLLRLIIAEKNVLLCHRKQAKYITANIVTKKFIERRPNYHVRESLFSARLLVLLSIGMLIKQRALDAPNLRHGLNPN